MAARAAAALLSFPRPFSRSKSNSCFPLPPFTPTPPFFRLAGSCISSSSSIMQQYFPAKQAPRQPNRFRCWAAEYKFPDPVPEFAVAETSRFETHMLEKLTKRNEFFGDSVEEIVDVCTEIFSTFLRTEYGGPGTLLVMPFVDMADTLREKGLPGAPQAARAALLWAQKHVDKDWNEWTAGENQTQING